MDRVDVTEYVGGLRHPSVSLSRVDSKGESGRCTLWSMKSPVSPDGIPGHSVPPSSQQTFEGPRVRRVLYSKSVLTRTPGVGENLSLDLVRKDPREVTRSGFSLRPSRMMCR